MSLNPFVSMQSVIHSYKNNIPIQCIIYRYVQPAPSHDFNFPLPALTGCFNVMSHFLLLKLKHIFAKFYWNRHISCLAMWVLARL